MCKSRVGAALALLATLLLLAQPVCAAAEPLDFAPRPISFDKESNTAPGVHHEPSDGPCCASLENAPLAASAPAPSYVGEQYSAIAPRPQFPEPHVAWYFAAASAVTPPLPLLPYHARSARIQR